MEFYNYNLETILQIVVQSPIFFLGVPNFVLFLSYAVLYILPKYKLEQHFIYLHLAKLIYPMTVACVTMTWTYCCIPKGGSGRYYNYTKKLLNFECFSGSGNTCYNNYYYNSSITYNNYNSSITYNNYNSSITYNTGQNSAILEDLWQLFQNQPQTSNVTVTELMKSKGTKGEL